MSVSPSTGISQPIRSSLSGNPYNSAYQQTIDAQVKQNALINAVSGGKNRRMKWGGETIQVNTITPLFKPSLIGPGNPIDQQVNAAAIQNQTFVQSQSSNGVKLVTGGKHVTRRNLNTSRRRKTKKSRKSSHKRKSRKSKNTRKSRK